MDIGSAVSRAMGITDAELAALPNYHQSPLFSPLEKLVLELAVAICRTPAEVPDRLRDALLEHLTPAQFTEVVATVAWENHRARINRALGVRAAGFSDGAYCVLPHRPQD
jgi:alkylhydroperoxidase family enzyme